MTQQEKERRARQILGRLHIRNPRCLQCVLALLDDSLTTPYESVAKALPDTKFSAGASTQHLLKYIKQKFDLGRRQFDFTGVGPRIDREERDSIFNPLLSSGIMRRVTWVRDGDTYKTEPGHLTANSQNSCYQLDPEFRQMIERPAPDFDARVSEWVKANKLRRQRAIQSEAAIAIRASAPTDNPHRALIYNTVENFAAHRFPGYKLIFVDDVSGKRIHAEWKATLAEAGLQLNRGDRYPDAILWSPDEGEFVIIDAVISDGEVDEVRAEDIRASFESQGKRVRALVTAYRTWKDAGGKQGLRRNLAADTLLWIAEDGGKYFKVRSLARTETGGEAATNPEIDAPEQAPPK